MPVYFIPRRSGTDEKDRRHRNGARRIAHLGPGPYRAYCDADEVREPRPFLSCNADIVDETEVLWVGSSSMEEPRRGARGQGTWWTAHYAEDHGRPLIITWPNGRTERRPPGVELTRS